ncbi:MAG: CPBP family intramembrane metalloprotease [Verrucomicrobia bacterium]|nr:CPBP family intramembrane metalloprotease [Verrucomicrobiota bacterium]
MQEAAFSHLIIWKNPITSMCFFAFGMSFISLWVRKTPALWASFLLIAYILAFEANIATWISLIPVLILFFCHYYLNKEIQKSARFLLFGSAVVLSLALAFHFLPGFHNWKLAADLAISPGAYPYNLWFNFDKPFIGIFALAFGIPLISSRPQLLKVLKLSIPMSLAGILIMMGISLHFDLVKWDPKIPVIFFIWLIDNLIFVCIPEEAFFRGFIQRWLFNWFGETPLAGFGSIFVTSIFFTLLHLIWVANLPFLCLVFVASMIYGTIYQVTKSIEASIFCHFGLNLTHLLLFTYPALQG